MTTKSNNIFAILDTESDSDNDSNLLLRKKMSKPKPKPNPNSNSNLYKLELDTEHSCTNKKEKFKKRKLSKKSIYSKLLFDSNGALDELNGLPLTIEQAVHKKQNLTLKQITSIMGLNGLWGEMYNVIHDKIQLEVKRHQIKITHHSRVFYVSLYNWYDLKKIEQIIESMLVI